MTGTHRSSRGHRRARTGAAPRRRPGGRAVSLVLVLVVGLAVAFVILHQAGSPADDTAPSASVTSRTPGPTSTPSTTPSASTPSASSSPSSSPRAPRIPPLADLPALSVDQPKRITSTVAHLDAGFDLATTSDSGMLTASARGNVVRNPDRGSPGSPGTDTVVVYGDSTPGTGPLDRLDALAVGDQVSITTVQGVLTYQVTSVADLPDDQVMSSAAVRPRVPGRLVVVATRLSSSGAHSATDVVVVARLAKVQPG